MLRGLVAHWTLLLAVFSIACAQTRQAASNFGPPVIAGIPRFEADVQGAQIRTFCVGTLDKQCGIPSFALGPSGTLNLRGFLSVDASYLTTPSAGVGATTFYGGRVSELLAGVRAEARARHYGFFVEAQPGYLQWHHVITGISYPVPCSYWVFDYGHATHFISDVGPGFEYSPSSRLHIRGELTDLIYRFNGATWNNYFQPSVTVTYGLGKPLRWRPPVYDGARHPFFSPLNDTLLLGSALAISADAVTTQRFLAHGGLEGDPIARPLVKYGWSGQVAASGLELGAEVLAMYGMHRINHRWLERLLPVGVATAHGIFAYGNDQDAGAGR